MTVDKKTNCKMFTDMAICFVVSIFTIVKKGKIVHKKQGICR